MASVSRSFSRIALSCARQARSTTRNSSSLPSYCSRRIFIGPKKAFSTTSYQYKEELKEKGSDETAALVPDSEVDPTVLREIDHLVSKIDREAPTSYPELKKQNGYWAEEEEDEFISTVEDCDDEFRNDDITSMGHDELQEHRELREYARIIAWDMPSLSSLAKPFSLPPQTHLLRFRHTTYLGETHPAETKIVLEVCSKDLTPTYLTEAQRITLLKLAGPRYNPDTDLIRMSCEKFPTRAQNKRYLGDLINTLIKEAKEGDAFEDIPLTFPHHKSKPKFTFPESWNMTSERKKELERSRVQGSLGDGSHEPGAVVDGNSVIEHAIRTVPELSMIRGASGFGGEAREPPAGARRGGMQRRPRS
ncbi:37S ribosomal protein S24, mitochondrial [Myotisia sp. PD_48]|nr:37S ribosomal protein S24, mitochondrial [Myotisia sp. PD_48]